MQIGACARSSLFNGAVVCVRREQASLTDHQSATRQTIERMGELALRSRAGLAVEITAMQIRNGAVVRPGPRPITECEGVWWFLRRSLRFVHDAESLAALLNAGDDLELLIEPELLLRMSAPFGDCDEYAMAAAALVLNLGLEAELVTMAVEPLRPWRWSHVFAQAVLPCGRRFVLDPTPHASRPGWVVPFHRRYRVQEWDLSGRPIRTGGYEG